MRIVFRFILPVLACLLFLCAILLSSRSSQRKKLYIVVVHGGNTSHLHAHCFSFHSSRTRLPAFPLRHTFIFALISKKEALHSCRSRRQHQSSTCALFFVSFFPYSLACFSFAPYFYLRAQLKKLPIPPQPRHRRSPSYPTIPPSPCASIPSASLISTNSAPPMPRNFLSKLCRPTQ